LKPAREIAAKYADERIGLADAANTVLAERFHTTKIATLDQRHYTVLRMPDGRPLEIIP
jgi:predicted nucleic acid-binding protein